MPQGFEIHIQGAVQGVGFRPHVYQVANALGLTGRVFNHGYGVCVELNADASQRDSFLTLLHTNLPPLADIEHINWQVAQHLIPAENFTITASAQGQMHTQVVPDAATCQHCVSELLDPKDRRFHYPFINCTHCGPRHSIIQDMPYDRAKTTMRDFTLCAKCQQEYDDPLDRRFHAQPNACPDCGPHLQLIDNHGTLICDTEAVAQAVNLLAQGKIVAIKGIGGYHLACDAQNFAAVERLRAMKQRPSKPLTVMVADHSSAQQVVELTACGERHLQSTAAPIVLAKKRTTAFNHLAPALNWLGVMLPYAPIHYLLFEQMANSPNDWQQAEYPPAIVMTSANLRGQPLIYCDEQHPELFRLCDAILTHNRAIDKRIDDSIINCVGEQAIIIRRGRGMTPKAITLATSGPSTLAVGALLKNTICITKGNQAYVSQYIGDLNNPHNCRYLKQTVNDLLKLFAIEPEQVVTDLHPDFYSRQFAEQFAREHKIPLRSVQHHQAHAAAVAAEHQLSEPYLAICLDGIGLGDDGQAWGGELLFCHNQDYERVGYLQPIKLPGADKAAKEPWRLAVAFLLNNNQRELAEQRYGDFSGFVTVCQMVDRQINCPTTSSAGRLFDLAASLLNISHHNDFEAESAMKLESAAFTAEQEASKPTNALFTLTDNQLDFTPLLTTLLDLTPERGAKLFHQQFVAGLCQWLVNQQATSSTVVLAGGCFLNAQLSQLLTARLQQLNFQVYTAQQLPPNDSAIALGQAWVGLQQAKR